MKMQNFEESPPNTARINACLKQCKILKFKRDGNINSGCPCIVHKDCRFLFDADQKLAKLFIIEELERFIE